MQVVGALFGLALLLALIGLPLFIAARRPVLRRLAIRNAVRRPRETVLVLLGALLGTAIITGSAVVGDTLGASIRRAAYTQLGPIDEVVQASGLESGRQVRAALEGVRDPAVESLLPMLAVEAAIARTGDGPARAEPSVVVREVDFDAARRFGGDERATGIEGATPGPGQVALSRDLARSLDVSVGDAVRIYAYGSEHPLQVALVLPRLGVAGFKLGFGSESFNAFVAPGTIAGLTSAAAAGPGAPTAAPPVAMVLASNPGGVIDGAEGTDGAVEALEGALGSIPATVLPVKADLLRGADQAGEQFGQLFTSIGFFAVLAGILLLVNIFVMLAQERKTELGMLRAVGMRRASLVGGFYFEGWLYALIAAALGAVVGLGVGRVIVYVAAGIFADGGRFGLELHYTATAASVIRGFFTGFVLAAITVLGTSFSVARLNVIRAIRDLPEPTSERQRTISVLLGAVAVVVGGVLAASGFSASSAIPLVVGPPVVGLGLVGLLGRFLARRSLVTVVSVLTIVWTVTCFDLVPDAFKATEISLFVVTGIVLTAAAVAMVSQNQDVIGHAIRRVGGGSRNMALRLGLAYPLARRFRTGMILSMYSLVVFTLTSITLFSSVFATQIDTFTNQLRGGFDLRVFSNPANPLTEAQLRSLPEVDELAQLTSMGQQFTTASIEDPTFFGITGFTEDLVAGGPPQLQDRGRYATDEEAYRAVLADPSLIIVDQFFLQQGAGPPEGQVGIDDQVTMKDPQTGRTRQLTVVALAEQSPDTSSALIAVSALIEQAGPRAVPNLAYVKVKDGADPQDLASRIQGQFLANGAEAVSFRKLVADGLANQVQFFNLMRGYLALGLLVGIAGLGVVMVRAVRERRRQVGVLRALGFDARTVRRAFVSESAFVASEGILIGVLLALLSTWRLLTTDVFGEGVSFTVPWVQLAFLVLFTVAASLLATLAPAHQASKIRPAVALRIAD